MVTNYPQQLTATATADHTGHTELAATFLSRAAIRAGQWFCALRGHDAVLHFERNRVMMRCTSCGHDTPGWEVSNRAPRQRFEGDRRRHMLVPQRLVLRKSA